MTRERQTLGGLMPATERGMVPEKEKPLLDILIDDALRRFREKETIEDGERIKGYTTIYASWDAVRESGKTPDELFTQLTNQTGIPLTDLTLPGEDHDLDWNSFKILIAEDIVAIELERRFPETIEEDERREKLYRKQIKYEPVTNKMKFVGKWLEWLEGDKSDTQFTAEHLYQLALDIFASRRGKNWRDCDRFINDEEKLVHPDGRRINVSFDERAGSPLFAEIIFFPDKETAEEGNYDYNKSYELRPNERGIVVIEDNPETGVDQEIILDTATCAQLCKDLLEADFNTP